MDFSYSKANIFFFVTSVLLMKMVVAAAVTGRSLLTSY